MINYILIALYLVFSLAGVFLFKIGCQKEFMISLSTGIFSLHISLLSILGLISYVCSFLMYMFLISKFDMTYIVPVTTGLTYIICGKTLTTNNIIVAKIHNNVYFKFNLFVLSKCTINIKNISTTIAKKICIL